MLHRCRNLLNNPKGRITFFLVIAIAGITLDQLSKYWARAVLVNGSKYIGNTDIGLSLTSNSGSAFSMFQDSTLVLTMLSAIIIVVIIFATFKSTSPFLSLSCMLIATGAFGNWLDRFFQSPYKGSGHVTDFIKVGSFPTFNVADSLVTIGACVMVLSAFCKTEAINES